MNHPTQNDTFAAEGPPVAEDPGWPERQLPPAQPERARLDAAVRPPGQLVVALVRRRADHRDRAPEQIRRDFHPSLRAGAGRRGGEQVSSGLEERDAGRSERPAFTPVVEKAGEEEREAGRGP
jgi:hypothetical protein